MRTFTQKPRGTQPATPTRSTTLSRAHVGEGHDPNLVLSLRGAIGNQALLRLLQGNAEERNSVSTGTASSQFGHDSSRIPVTPPIAGTIQTKLAITAPGDEYEQEADRVAEQVMRMPEPQLQRACACGGKCPRCQTEHSGKEPSLLQMKCAGENASRHMTAPPLVHEVLGSPGQRLDRSARNFFEPRFGHDFSKVRVHSDIHAGQAARSVNARAFTVGRSIVFGAGEYVPESSEGRSLLAHELAHVVQQTGSDAFSKTLHAPASLQRYHHTSSCTATDLSSVVWPGDSVMRRMVAKAIRVLSASPIDPLVTALFPKYFMTATPAVATILAVFNSIDSVLTADDYWYECEHDCGAEEAAYVRDRLRYLGLNPHLHPCINHMSGYSLNCNASLILHEMSHYAAHLDDEAIGCGSCSTAGCPVSLSASDALDNTYSYANFALELYPLPV